MFHSLLELSVSKKTSKKRIESLIDGEHRIKAAKEVSKKTSKKRIESMVSIALEEQFFAASFKENLKKED